MCGINKFVEEIVFFIKEREKFRFLFFKYFIVFLDCFGVLNLILCDKFLIVVYEFKLFGGFILDERMFCSLWFKRRFFLVLFVGM